MQTTIYFNERRKRATTSSSILKWRMGDRVFNFAMDSLNPNLLNERLNLVFGSFKCAVSLNVAFGFVLKKMKLGSCRYYYPHENITLMEGSKLVATKDNLKKIGTSFNNVDAIESCKTERANTKWKFHRVVIVKFFAALLKEVPMACINAVSPEPLIRNRSVNCLTFENSFRNPYNDNLCLYIASSPLPG